MLGQFHEFNEEIADKRVVIVHDWLTVYGGAERVLRTLLELFPNADVATLLCTLPKNEHSWLQETKVITSDQWLLKTFPKRYRTFLPLMPKWIEQLDLSEYDVVISSSHAVAKGVICGPSQLHVSYIYSPMRYAWDLQFEHLERGDFGSGIKAWLIKGWLHRIRIWDAISFLRADKLISTSKFIQNRIKKVCNRGSDLVYPPVNFPNLDIFDTSLNDSLRAKKYYVVISRLVPYKSIDKIILAFNQMQDKNLIIIGDGPIFNQLKGLAKNNIKLIGSVSEDEKISYLLNAQAFIHMAIEDFGIAPLEAQYAGLPVIGYSKGALSETIKDITSSNRASGILFHEQTVDALNQAILQFENQNLITKENCQLNAIRFSKERFMKEFSRIILEMLKSDEVSLEV